MAALDFFEAPGRSAANDALSTAEVALAPDHVRHASPGSRIDRGKYRARTWVTRQGVFVDRIASAWLIRRFIDPDARFRFVTSEAYKPTPNELRFDMFEGEFTHEGDRCTFEVLIDRFMPNDPALQAIAEVVHDIDLKDGKFGRDDTPGIERVLGGIASAHSDDAARVERARQLFDELHAVFSRETGAAT